MPTISASPNPVGVYSAATPAETIVSWNTDGRFNGIVYVSVNGMKENPLPGQGSGAPSGTGLKLQVYLGNVYLLSLRRADDINVELESVVVTTFDLRQQIAAGFSQTSLPQLRPQIITNVVVKPGIDTVRISFGTTLPTIPTTEIRDNNGAWVDGRMPLFGGRRTRHEVVFGIETPLALNKKHSFKIEAFGQTNNPSSPNKAVVTGEFITGTRNVDVMYEMLDVHDDSDSTGSGELSFAFGVGDVETGSMLGSPAFMKRDISDDDPPIDLGIKLPLTDVHRQLWLQVLASDNDADPWPWVGLGARGMRPSFDGPGGSYRDDDTTEFVELTIVVDVDTDPGPWSIPFELRTGDWPLDFVVAGHLEVNAIEGSVISTKIGKLGPSSKSSSFLTEPGSIARLALGGVDERTEDVALGGDGAFYHRSLRRERSKTGGGSGWTRVELPGRGTPAVSAVGDMLDLIDLDERGGVLHSRFDPRKPKGVKWRRLGGDFAQVVPAVEPGKGRGAEPGLILFGVADDGGLFVRDASGEGRDWDRLGDRPARVIAPVSAAGARAALFAVGENGALLHFDQRNGRWRQQELSRVPGDSPTQLLTVVVMDRIDGKDAKSSRRDLVIAAMGEDHSVRVLRWQDYPAGSPEKRWQELGSVQDLLLEGQAISPKRKRISPKS
jgi:hypothetical protein